MKRVRVKICGMTDAKIVDAAVALGVDAVGFIFVAKSPRVISPAKAKEIISSLPPFIDAVGVFMDAEFQLVCDRIDACCLTAVQLHGAETPEYCGRLPCPVIKTMHMKPDMGHLDPISLYGPYLQSVRGFLLDTYHKDLGGGTGRPFDWTLLEKIRPPKPFLLAGGLHPENIANAIRVARPYGVDVNSGVEMTKGIKDVALIRQLMEAVRREEAKG